MCNCFAGDRLRRLPAAVSDEAGGTLRSPEGFQEGRKDLQDRPNVQGRHRNVQLGRYVTRTFLSTQSNWFQFGLNYAMNDAH